MTQAIRVGEEYREWLICRAALRDLVSAGVLAPGVSPKSRPRQPTPQAQQSEQGSVAILDGVLERVTFSNPEPGYCALPAASPFTDSHEMRYGSDPDPVFTRRRQKSALTGVPPGPVGGGLPVPAPAHS